MIYPIIAYGNPLLRRTCTDVAMNDQLKVVVDNMFETMNHCNGVGLAAPQVGITGRIFIVDNTKTKGDDGRRAEDEPDVKEVFINAEILEEFDKPTSMEEGCLSIPGIYGNVVRPGSVRIRYYDGNYQLQVKVFHGFAARIIQHEYDHIEGILFVDKLKSVKKQMIRRKLEDIKKGVVDTKYKMKFASL